MKTGKNTSNRVCDVYPIARRFTVSPVRSQRCGSVKACLCSTATRLAPPIVDLLLDILVWLFRIRDDAPSDLVFGSPIHMRLPQGDGPPGDGHA
jgi:hypothetical protein